MNAGAMGNREYAVVTHAFKILPGPYLEGIEIIIELSEVYRFSISFGPESTEFQEAVTRFMYPRHDCGITKKSKHIISSAHKVTPAPMLSSQGTNLKETRN